MAGSWFDRFVHPRVARVAAAGAAVWLGSFAVALAGLLVRANAPTTAGLLFFLSGVVGVVGMLLLAACGGYVLVVKLRHASRA